MQETINIFEAAKSLIMRGKKAALATVVRTSGSTYRKEGAKMLIRETGETVGSISAGCLESDVLEIVPEIIKTGKPKLLKYDNTTAEEIIWGLGLGCNGIVEVFVEPLADSLQNIESRVRNEEAFAIATVIKSESEDEIKPGLKMLTLLDGSTEGSLGKTGFENRIKKDALELLANEKSRTVSYMLEYSKAIDVYIEPVYPPSPLVIFGGDPDAAPIVNLAKQLGFKVTLVDHRPNVTNSKKYANVDEAVVASSDEVKKKVPLNEKTFVLIKTHNYLKDKEILNQVLKSKACYIGQLGPKARTEDLLKDLSEEGANFNRKELARLYAPAGLDVAAESPEEISLSILSEILAVKNERQGGFLKNQIQAIHPRD